MRRVKEVVAVVAALTLVSGCAGGATEFTVPTPSINSTFEATVWDLTQRQSDLQVARLQLGIDDAPEVDIIGWVRLEDQYFQVLHCMDAAGFPDIRDLGVLTDNVPPGQQQEFNLA